jgi:hypothetical protein
MIFTHTFAFGLLSRLEGTGRALAATPAMLMVGSAVGPLLGGTLVKFFGYPVSRRGRLRIRHYRRGPVQSGAHAREHSSAGSSVR